MYNLPFPSFTHWKHADLLSSPHFIHCGTSRSPRSCTNPHGGTPTISYVFNWNLAGPPPNHVSPIGLPTRQDIWRAQSCQTSNVTNLPGGRSRGPPSDGARMLPVCPAGGLGIGVGFRCSGTSSAGTALRTFLHYIQSYIRMAGPSWTAAAIPRYNTSDITNLSGRLVMLLGVGLATEGPRLKNEHCLNRTWDLPAPGAWSKLHGGLPTW